jgi:uncharacterized membrane protein
MSTINDEPPKLESSEPSDASGPEITKITAEVTRQVITRVSKFFSGPLPPPEVLIGYNEAFQGAAERIVAMAESQLKHRQGLESKVVESNCRNERTGQIIGAVLSGIAILGGIYLAAHDKPLSGFGVILVDLTAFAGIFVYTRREQSKERADKLKPFKAATGQTPPTPSN